MKQSNKNQEMERIGKEMQTFKNFKYKIPIH